MKQARPFSAQYTDVSSSSTNRLENGDKRGKRVKFEVSTGKFEIRGGRFVNQQISLLMDDNGGSGSSDLSLEELMDEYSSRPPQIAEWLWCIEYVAKFVKDIRCILDLMNLGYQYSNDYGRRINEILSLRILEFMFDPSKNDPTGVGVASNSKPRVEFDFSSSNADVLRAILKKIPVSELRAGMPELSNFNVLPFIAHKNMCLPQCALEKLRDVSLTENQTSAAPSMEANDAIFRDDRFAHMNTEPIDNQQVNQNINEMDKVISIDDGDEQMHNNEKDEVIVIDSDTQSDQDTVYEPITPSSKPWPENARVKCTTNGTWLISGSDDESDMDINIRPLSSRTKPKNVCWKCKKGGTLLICSRSDCAAKVHKKCLRCEVNVDEDGNFYCPVCWYDQVAREYFDTQKLMISAKRRLVKFLPLLSARIKRLK